MHRIIRLTRNDPPAYFEQVAGLHALTIHHGLLPQLGLPFLSRLYQAIGATRSGFVLAAVCERQILGFVAGSINMRRMYAAIMMQNGWGLFQAAKGALIHLASWQKAWDVIWYPLRRHGERSSGRPAAVELLAIAVDPDRQRRGLGDSLIRAFETEVLSRGAYPAYTVATNAAEPASNQFYRKMGFRPAGQIPHHQLVLQAYHKAL